MSLKFFKNRKLKLVTIFNLLFNVVSFDFKIQKKFKNLSSKFFTNIKFKCATWNLLLILANFWILKFEIVLKILIQNASKLEFKLLKSQLKIKIWNSKMLLVLGFINSFRSEFNRTGNWSGRRETLPMSKLLRNSARFLLWNQRAAGGC